MNAEMAMPDMAKPELPNTQYSKLDAPVRRAFVLALLLGGMSLITMVFSPLASGINAAMLFILAYGIRRGSAGPAIALGGYMLVRLAVIIPGATLDVLLPFSMAALFLLGLAAFAFWGAWVAWNNDKQRKILPWMLALAGYAVSVFLVK